MYHHVSLSSALCTQTTCLAYGQVLELHTLWLNTAAYNYIVAVCVALFSMLHTFTRIQMCLDSHANAQTRMHASVVAITEASQSTTIAIFLVSKHYDYHYHYGSPLK